MRSELKNDSSTPKGRHNRSARLRPLAVPLAESCLKISDSTNGSVSPVSSSESGSEGQKFSSARTVARTGESN